MVWQEKTFPSPSLGEIILKFFISWGVKCMTKGRMLNFVGVAILIAKSAGWLKKIEWRVKLVPQAQLGKFSESVCLFWKIP